MGDMLIGYLNAVVRTSAPLLLIALGGVISYRVGVTNMTLEGIANIGAFAGALASYFGGSFIVSILSAMAAGMLLSLLFFLFIEKFKGNEIIVAIGINTLSGGLTTFLSPVFFNAGIVGSADLTRLPTISFGLLERVPIINDIFNNFTLLIYVAPILTILVWAVMYKTNLGVKLRASGESPQSLETAGISSRKYRTVGVVITGILAALGGVHLSLGYVTQFSEGIISGRGFIAYSASVFGQGKPFLTWIVCIVFAMAEALSYRAQALRIPSHIVSMMPYVVTIIALCIQSNAAHKKKSLSLG